MVTTNDDVPTYDAHQETVGGIRVMGSVAELLVAVDRETSILAETALAKSWEFSADGKTLTFKLNEGVKFHDGQPFTCDDVQYSFGRIMNPPEGMASPRKANFFPVDNIQCSDPLTVVFNLKNPWADSLPTLANAYNVIYPKHIAQPNDREGKFMRNTLIGTGPFKLKRVVSGEGVEVERFDGYWQKGADGKPLPYLDGINTVYIAGTQVQSMVAGFEAGRFQFIHTLNSPSLAAESAAKGKGKWTILEFPITLDLEFVPDMHPGSPWNDIEMRKAAALALCQDEFTAVMGDIAFVRWFGTPMPPGSPFNLPMEEIRQIPGYGPDCDGRRAEARQILERIGQVGYEIDMRAWGGLARPRDSAVTACGLLIQVGFKCVNTAMETGPFFTMMNTQSMPVGAATTHTFNFSAYTVDEIFGAAHHPDGIRNYGAYEDDKIPPMFDAQSKELDFEKRKQLLWEYQRYFLKQYRHVILAWSGIAKAYWNSVHGPSIENGPPVLFATVWQGDTWMDQ